MRKWSLQRQAAVLEEFPKQFTMAIFAICKVWHVRLIALNKGVVMKVFVDQKQLCQPHCTTVIQMAANRKSVKS